MTQPDKAAQLKVIWKSPLIPADPMVWSKALTDSEKTKIRDFFANYGDTEAEKAVLKNMQLGKFLASNDDQLLPIRQLELFKQRTTISADSKLAEADKAKKLAQIDADLATLQQRLSELDKKPDANG